MLSCVVLGFVIFILLRVRSVAENPLDLAKKSFFSAGFENPLDGNRTPLFLDEQVLRDFDQNSSSAFSHRQLWINRWIWKKTCEKSVIRISLIIIS